MKVLFASMELAPFSKVGGLGDVAQALPEALSLLGVEVTLITPWYSSFPGRFPVFDRLRTLRTARLPLGGQQVRVAWKTPVEPLSGVRLILVEEPAYLSKQRPYSGAFLGVECSKEPEGSILFSKAIADWVRNGDEDYDLVHLNEHHTALAAPLLRRVSAAPPVMTTVHNFYHQGVHEAGVLPLVGPFQDETYPTGPFEFYGKVNFLKAGLWYSDLFTTVSKTYREEVLQDDHMAQGLAGFLKSRADKFVGILNGINHLDWNPRRDPYLMPHFSAERLEGKQKIKARLLGEMGMSPGPAPFPMVASVILRLVEQKGVDLILAVAERLLQKGALLIVMGEGREDYVSAFEALEARHPAHCRLVPKYEERLAHRITAGADVFLMPSRFEPCGLTQLYSMAYGTVPVVRRTGGLADTVIDARAFPTRGTGFCFKNSTPAEFWEALSASLEAYQDRKKWRAILRRGMRKNHGWDISARTYRSLYDGLLQNQPAPQVPGFPATGAHPLPELPAVAGGSDYQRAG